MKCKQCPIVSSCAYTDKGPGGMCYFETSDTIKDFDARWKLIDAMRQMLKNERLLIGRLEKELSRRSLSSMGEEGDTTFLILKMHNYLLGLHGQHLEKFGHFMGWKADGSEDDQQKKKDETLNKVFSREMKKKEEEEEAQKEIEEMASV